jgi:ArsR family transcriptional regulator
MAEALLRDQAGDFFEVFSAGTQPEAIAKQTIKALVNARLDTDHLSPKHVSEFDHTAFDYIISLCDKAANECQHYPANGKRMDWQFEDPKSRSCINPFDTTLSDIDRRIKMFIAVETDATNRVSAIDPIQFYKNLTDDIRLKCLMLIQYEGELCVCELMAALEDIQPKVSRNLALLRKSGLLIDRKHSQWVYYRINPSLPAWAKAVLAATTESNVSYIADSIKNLNQMGSRPNRMKAFC